MSDFYWLDNFKVFYNQQEDTAGNIKIQYENDYTRTYTYEVIRKEVLENE